MGIWIHKWSLAACMKCIHTLFMLWSSWYMLPLLIFLFSSSVHCSVYASSIERVICALISHQVWSTILFFSYSSLSIWLSYISCVYPPEDRFFPPYIVSHMRLGQYKWNLLSNFSFIKLWRVILLLKTTFMLSYSLFLFFSNCSPNTMTKSHSSWGVGNEWGYCMSLKGGR